jgi:valyl-tRNA synthetase
MWDGRQANKTELKAMTNGEGHGSQVSAHSFALHWFENRLREVQLEVTILMKQFRLSEALKTIYSLIWDDFCSWYLEWVKPGFEQHIEAVVYDKTVYFFEELMQLLHPFMPFISEEIYQLLKPQTTDLCVVEINNSMVVNKEILSQGELLKKVISALRDARNKNQVKPKESIQLHVQTDHIGAYDLIQNIIAKQVNADAIFFTNEPVPDTIVVAIEKDKFYLEAATQLNSATLKNDLLKDLEHQQNFLQSVIKKLANERFVQNAKPEVIALEQKKRADAEARIKTIEESLALLN